MYLYNSCNPGLKIHMHYMRIPYTYLGNPFPRNTYSYYFIKYTLVVMYTGLRQSIEGVLIARISYTLH